MRIVFISDTHCRHREIRLPEGDMLIHAGDFSGRGERDEVEQFLAWFSSLDFAHKIFIAGNHDFLAEDDPEAFAEMVPDDLLYLNEDGVEISGIKIWGSPITPWFFDWAFNRQRGDEIARHWERIPTATDLLITHGPPLGVLDRTVNGTRAGCEELLQRVEIVRPRIHVFGHIHEGHGILEKGPTTFINGSSLDFRYQPVHQPAFIDW